MPIVQSSRYRCFARFLTHALGTDREYRSGVWHDPHLVRDVSIEQKFEPGGVIDPRGFDLVIADQLQGTYQTLVADGGLDGTSVVVETVCDSTMSDGTTDTQTKTETLTIRGSRLEPGKAIITLVDIEDRKLAELYPADLWSATTFRDMAQSDTGVSIPRPIGTARKLKAALLSADTTNAYYYFGVCDAPQLTLPIVAISTGSKTFTVAGDYSDRISAGTVLFSSTSSANAGRFTATAAAFGGVNTVVTVSETISSATVSGNLLVPPTVLAVYRDGRLVASTEYEVHMTWPVLTQMPDPDFDGSPVDWVGANFGTGTGSIISGVSRFTGDGTVTNYGRLTSGAVTAECQRGAFSITTITLVTAGKVRLNNFSISLDGNAVVSGQGTHTAFVRQWYTDGRRRIDLSNYNTGYSGTVDVDNISLSTAPSILLVRFIREQVDFDGSAHTIEVDVRGVESRNVVDEISRLLTASGCTPDTGTFSTAQAYATTHSMLVDCDHGSIAIGSTGQRRYRAIIEDLLFIARGNLYRTATGTYGIVQDKTGTSSATFSETDGDLIEVMSLQRPPRPSSVGISYLPNAVDPRRTTHTIERSVIGGVLGSDRPRECRYLSDHTAADRLTCYLALRAEFDRLIRFRQWRKALSLGDVISIISPPVGIHSSLPVWIKSTQQIPAGVECEAVEYSANVHTYTAATLPIDALAVYQPDYSKTPPVAPTALTITAGSTALGTDGATVARITVTAIAPAVNWSEMWFVAIHNTTNEITGLMRGDLTTGTTYGGTLTGLRPGEVYQLKSYAVNSFGVQGVVLGTFNATAIGGGASTTTFTAPGYATAPATVSSCTAAQGMGRLVRVTWANVTTANLAKYALEKKIGAGAFAEIARPLADNFTDTDVAIGTAYQYRVRAVDTYGNLSAAYATSGTVTLTSTVTGGNGTGDISTNTVETANRNAVSAFSVAMTPNPGALRTATFTITHSIGKKPLLTLDCGGKTSFIATLGNVSTTTADITAMGTGNGNTADTATPAVGVLHSHVLLGFVETGTIYLNAW